MNIGNKIRKIRELKGYSQDYMATRLNMSQNNYSKIELGHGRLDEYRLMFIAEILTVSPEIIKEFDEQTILKEHVPKDNIIQENWILLSSKLLEELIKSKDDQIALLKEELIRLRSTTKEKISFTDDTRQ